MNQLDPEGYIRPEADLANVQPEYQGLPEAAAGLLAEEFGPRLHSAYLYGSVVRGNAVPGRSDVDVVAVLLAAPVDKDRARADRVERALVERFPVLFSAGVGLSHLQEVRSPAQRYGLQVFLRELAVCICGEDLRPGLPRTKPSAAVAAGFHDDTHAVLARARQTLDTSTDPEVIRRVGRMASRRMVQVAFAVVMAREGVWATVLEEQTAAVGAAFPQWAEAARRAAEQGRRPVADAGDVRELLDTFGRWAEDALDRAVVTHPRHQLDPVIHAPTRFSIMAALMAADKVEFRFIRDTVELTDSALSQQLTTLEQAGYVKITKGQVGRRPRTWLAATPAGRAAFSRHLAVLNQLATSSAGPHDDGTVVQTEQFPGSA